MTVVVDRVFTVRKVWPHRISKKLELVLVDPAFNPRRVAAILPYHFLKKDHFGVDTTHALTDLF
jgi:hypothetical protein